MQREGRRGVQEEGRRGVWIDRWRVCVWREMGKEGVCGEREGRRGYVETEEG